jgi:hypothetical protein
MVGKTSENPVLSHFGRQVRKERLARGWSLDELAARTGMGAGHWSRIENGKRPPTEAVARAADRAFPERRGWFLEYYEESKSWTPAGFRNWAEYEDKATNVRAWMPGILHGLVQTENYARAMLRTYPGVTDEILAARLRSRMERQRRILMRDDAPAVWFIVDQMALYRDVGGADVMADQMRHLAEIATMPNVRLQVLPAVAHPAGAGELIVTDDAAYAEHIAGGLVFTEPETVATLANLFVTIQVESLRASESVALIEEVGDIWTTHGESQATAAPTGDRA